MSAFRNPMGREDLRQRLVLANHNPIYDLACHAAGHQGTVVDHLSWKLKQRLPGLIAELATEVESELQAKADARKAAA